MKTFSKIDDKTLKVETSQAAKIETYSYDRILNEIQAHEEQLIYWNNLKEEADKLGLKR